jgi:hypothetical protein
MVSAAVIIELGQGKDPDRLVAEAVALLWSWFGI